MSNHYLLRHANLHCDVVTVSTDKVTHENCRIIFVGDEVVGFKATHPLKELEYDFELWISEIKEVKNITNNQLMWFQQPAKENSNVK